MQLQKYEVDAIISEISSGKLKKSGKTLTISNVKLQAFLKRPASVQQASIQDLHFHDGTSEEGHGFAHALLQFADTTDEIGAKAQVLRQMANDLRKQTEACLQKTPGGKKRGSTGQHKRSNKHSEYATNELAADDPTVRGLDKVSQQMQAMRSGDYRHLAHDLGSNSQTSALLPMAGPEELTATLAPLEKFMSALEKHHLCAAEIASLQSAAADSDVSALGDENRIASILQQLKPQVCKRDIAAEGGNKSTCMQAQDTVCNGLQEESIALVDVVAALGMSELHTRLQQAKNSNSQQQGELVLSPIGNTNAAGVPCKRQRILRPEDDSSPDMNVHVGGAGLFGQCEGFHSHQQQVDETAQDRISTLLLEPLEKASMDMTPAIDAAHGGDPAEPSNTGFHARPLSDPAISTEPQICCTQTMECDDLETAKHAAGTDPTVHSPGAQPCSRPPAHASEATDDIAAGINHPKEPLGGPCSPTNVRSVQGFRPELHTAPVNCQVQECMHSDCRGANCRIKHMTSARDRNRSSDTDLLASRADLSATVCEQITDHQVSSSAATARKSMHAQHEPAMEDELQDWRDVGLDDGGRDWGQEMILERVDPNAAHAQHHHEHFNAFPEDMRVDYDAQAVFDNKSVELPNPCCEPNMHGAVIRDSDEESTDQHADTDRAATASGANLRKPLLFRSKPVSSTPLYGAKAVPKGYQEHATEASVPAGDEGCASIVPEQLVVHPQGARVLRRPLILQRPCTVNTTGLNACNRQMEAQQGSYQSLKLQASTAGELQVCPNSGTRHQQGHDTNPLLKSMQAHLRKEVEAVRDPKDTDYMLHQKDSPIEDEIGWHTGSVPRTQPEGNTALEDADAACGGARAGNSSTFHGRKPVIRRAPDRPRAQQQQHEAHRPSGAQFTPACNFRHSVLAHQ